MNVADESVKLLDNGWSILLRRNELGSYTGVACRPGQDVTDAMKHEAQITDDFTPSDVLRRLTDKVFGCGANEGTTDVAST